MKRYWIVLLALVLLLTACERKDPEQTVPPTITPATTVPATMPTTAPTEPPVTAQSLLEGAFSGEDITFYEQKMVMDLTMKMEGAGMTLKMSMNMEGEVRYDYEKDIGYSETVARMSIFGQKVEQVLRAYSMTEGDTTVSYAYDGSSDTWVKQEIPAEENDLFHNLTMEEAVLREETQEYEGIVCYVLDIPTDPEMVLNNTESTNEVLGAVDLEMDMSVLKATTAMYINAETGELVANVVTVEGMDTLYNQLFAQLFAMAEEAPENTITTQIKEFTLTHFGFSKGPVDVPELKGSELEDAKLRGHNPLQEDGTYLLKDEFGQASIRVPEGWRVVASQYNMLDVSDGNGLLDREAVTSGSFSVCELGADREWPELVTQLRELGLDCEEKEGKSINGNKTYRFVFGEELGLSVHMVVIPVSDEVGVTVTVLRYDDEDCFEELEALANAVLVDAN